MTLSIHSDVLIRIPGLAVLAVRIRLPRPAKPEIDEDEGIVQWWLERQAEMNSLDPLHDESVRPWVELWKALGLSLKRHPPSIVSLLRRASRGGAPPRINPIVDCYNALSLELKLPFGAFDADALTGPLVLRLSVGGEKFHGIGAPSAEETDMGEIVYADDAAILTRHFLWRQSQQASIAEGTTNCVLVCELLSCHMKSLQHIRACCERRIEQWLRPEKLDWVIRP